MSLDTHLAKDRETLPMGTEVLVVFHIQVRTLVRVRVSARALGSASAKQHRGKGPVGPNAVLPGRH